MKDKIFLLSNFYITVVNVSSLGSKVFIHAVPVKYSDGALSPNGKMLVEF